MTSTAQTQLLKVIFFGEPRGKLEQFITQSNNVHAELVAVHTVAAFKSAFDLTTVGVIVLEEALTEAVGAELASILAIDSAWAVVPTVVLTEREGFIFDLLPLPGAGPIPVVPFVAIPETAAGVSNLLRGVVRDGIQAKSNRQKLYEVDAINERLKRSEAELRFLLQFSEALRLHSDPKIIAEETCRLLVEFLDVSRVVYSFVYLADDRADVVDALGPTGFSIAGEHRLSAYGSDFMTRMLAGELMRVDDTKTDPLTREHFHESYTTFSIRSIVVLPLMQWGECVGNLSLQHDHPRVWTEDEISLLKRVLGQVGDAIERARAQQSLLELNYELEKRVQERTTGLQEAVKELEGFSYSISHDLRAPLRAMVGHSRILAEDFGDKVPAEARASLQRIEAAARKMSDLIEDLLQYARLGRTEVRRTKFDLSELVLATLEALKEEFSFDEVEATITPGLIARADPELMKLSIYNLLHNSMKYRRLDRPLRLVFGKSDGAYFLQDNGIGFEAEYAGSLFEPFQRLHRDAAYPGTGIGLANVRRIIVRHHGKIWGEGTVGGGATFHFTLG